MAPLSSEAFSPDTMISAVQFSVGSAPVVNDDSPLSSCSVRKALDGGSSSSSSKSDDDDDGGCCQPDLQTLATAASSTATPPRKSVRFSDDVETVDVPHANNLTDREFYAIWWTAAEFRVIRHMIVVTLQLMERGQRFHPDDPDFCARGLECKQKRDTRRRQRRRDTARSSVIRAQRYQTEQGFRDDSYIADVYAINCQRARDEARTIGQADARQGLT